MSSLSHLLCSFQTSSTNLLLSVCELFLSNYRSMCSTAEKASKLLTSKMLKDKFRKHTDDTQTCFADVLLVSNPSRDE